MRAAPSHNLALVLQWEAIFSYMLPYSKGCYGKSISRLGNTDKR
jgi:hypothetical protein